MSLFEPRFIGPWSLLALQIEGSEPGSERAKELAVKTGLKIRYPQSSLEA